MSNEEAAKVLRDHNDWRRGGDGPQTDLRQLGMAIERAIAALEQNTTEARA